MYNIIHAWRPTDRRPEDDARGRTPRRPSNACAQGAREARGYRFIRGATQVRGRVGLVTPCVGATRTACHERRARNLRSGLRRVWTQVQATQTASTVTGVHSQGSPETGAPARTRSGAPPTGADKEASHLSLLVRSLRRAPGTSRNLLLRGNVITPDNTREVLPMSPVCFVTYVAGCTLGFFSRMSRN